MPQWQAQGTSGTCDCPLLPLLYTPIPYPPRPSPLPLQGRGVRRAQAPFCHAAGGRSWRQALPAALPPYVIWLLVCIAVNRRSTGRAKLPQWWGPPVGLHAVYGKVPQVTGSHWGLDSRQRPTRGRCNTTAGLPQHHAASANDPCGATGWECAQGSAEAARRRCRPARRELPRAPRCGCGAGAARRCPGRWGADRWPQSSSSAPPCR